MIKEAQLFKPKDVNISKIQQDIDMLLFDLEQVDGRKARKLKKVLSMLSFNFHGEIQHGS